jgi:hypothetical protein
MVSVPSGPSTFLVFAKDSDRLLPLFHLFTLCRTETAPLCRDVVACRAEQTNFSTGRASWRGDASLNPEAAMRRGRHPAVLRPRSGSRCSTWGAVAIALLTVLSAACSRAPQKRDEAIDLVANAINPANKSNVVAESLRSKPNPNGRGVFVYIEVPPKTLKIKQRFVWLVMNGKGYALNSPSKEVTPTLLWPRQATDDEWIVTGLNQGNAAIEGMKLVFGQ